MTNVSVTLTFSGSTVTGVAIAAGTSSLTIGSEVSASISSVNGSYDLNSKAISLTLTKVSISVSSFVFVGADSMSLTYNGSTGQSVNLVNASNTTSTDTVYLMTLGVSGAYVFAGVNGSADAASAAPTSQASDAEGLSVTGVNLALAVMTSTTTGAVYYGLSASAGTVSLVGLPSAFTLSVSSFSVGIDGSNGVNGTYVVNFDGTSFGSGGKGLSVSTGSTSIVLDYSQPVIEAGGTVDLSLDGYIYVSGTMWFQTGGSQTVNLTNGEVSNGSVVDVSTVNVSVLEVAATDVNVFAGINGPTAANPGVIPSNAVGVEINDASFALAFMVAADGTQYYGLQAAVGSSSNLIPSTATYNSSGQYQLGGLTQGDTYQWTQGAPTGTNKTSNDTSVVVDSSTTLTSNGTFVTTGSTVTLDGTAGQPVTAVVTPYDGVVALGLPHGVSISLGTVSVAINATTSTSSSLVVDFNSSFSKSVTTSNGTTIVPGLTLQTGTSSANLDFNSSLFSVSGNLTLDFDGFIYVTGTLAFQDSGAGGAVNLVNGSTPSTTNYMSILEVGASDVTVFAGVNGPGSNSGAKGLELDDATFALALISGADGYVYYGLQATAQGLSAVGLPTGFDVSGTNLGVAINGSNNSGTVVNFDSSFSTGTGGKGLAVATGGDSVTLDFSGAQVQVYGGINLQFGSYIGISGGFNYNQTDGAETIILGSGAYTGAGDLVFTVGSGSSTLFTATGSLNMTITSAATTITSASLTVSEIKVADVLDITSPSVSISNISIDNQTGAIMASGNSTLTVTASQATLFGGSSILNSTATGINGTFNLGSGAFAVQVATFNLNVESVLTASATTVNITYTPGAGSSQQILSIGSMAATFTFSGNSSITGSITNLVVYGDGFKFDSASLAYNGTITLGVLALTNPSVTVGGFSVTFDGKSTTLSANSLSVSVASASVTVGAVSASATGLTITVSLTDGSTTIVAGTLNFSIGTYLTLAGTNISISTNPASGDAYLSVGTATAALSAGSFSVSGTATNFSIINNNGTPEFQTGANFGISFTTPTPSQLKLPSWLGFSVTQFAISWPNFSSDPANFQIMLSASINSIQGLPSGVSVSGEITGAVIDLGMLERGEFPITSLGSIGGSVTGELFGMEVNAAFVLGIVQFNKTGEIVTNNGDGTVTVTKLTTNADGSVTESPDSSGSPTVVNSILYVGVSGGAEIPGVGGVQIYIGFSSLGPLTVYLSAEFPLILDPDTGIAIGGFSGGVTFDYTIPTPQQPTDLKTLVVSPANITISQWQTQLRDQTVVQYNSSSGGTNLAAAYLQPFVIEAGVTLEDAYLSADAFTITGNMAIQINPTNPNGVNIFVEGVATFGASVSFNAYLYLNLTVNGGATTATVMFLADAPAAAPVTTIGGALKLGFTDSSGAPILPTTIASGTDYDSSGDASVANLPAGTYTWTPRGNDTSLTVGSTTYEASQAASSGGKITFTLGAPETLTLTGTANGAVTASLTQQVAGFYVTLDGYAQFSAFGALTATVTGSVTLTVTGSFAKIDLSGDLSVSELGDLATASGELVVDYSSGLSGLQVYGALELQTGSGLAQLQKVGLYISGAATFVLNTTDSPQTVNLPDPNNPHVAADATPFTITDTDSFEVTVAGVGSTASAPTYASLSYETGGTTVFTMQGAFDLKISASGLTLYATINSLEVGPSSTPYVTFQGFGLFVINSQGFAAEMDLSLMTSQIEGFSLNAQFTLVMNTTMANVVYNIPSTLPGVTVPGTTSVVRSLTIPAGLPQGPLQADGTYGTKVGAAEPYIVITGQGSLTIYHYSFNGYFYFQLSGNSAGPVVAMYLNVTGDLGFGTVSVTGGFDLSAAGLVVLLEAGGSGGTSQNYGPGISLALNAELAINTTDSPVSSIGGVALTDTNGNPLTLAAKSAQVVASGSMTLSFGSGTLVINGLFGTTVTTTGSGVTEVDTTTITVNGTLTVTTGATTLLTANAEGVLVFAGPGPGNPNTVGTNGLGIAGQLAITVNGSDPLSGSGFTFRGTYDMEVNTTQAAQQVSIPGQAAPVTISAGPDGSTFGSAYVEIHANGTLVFGTNSGTATSPVYNGFVLNGDFYLVAGAASLAVSANVNLNIYVSGESLVTVKGTAAMIISSSGTAASLVVNAGVVDPAGKYGFDGTLTLQVNTTGVQQTIGTVVIPAGPGLNGASSSTGSPYFQVYINGTLALGTTDATVSASTSGMFVAGSFVLSLDSGGLVVAANGTLTAYVSGTPLLTMGATGALVINSTGIAGELSLSVNSGNPLNSSGLYSFAGTFNLQLNTTGTTYYVGTDGTVSTAVPAPGTSYVTISAGPNGSATAADYFEVEASGTLTFGSATNGFTLAGNLYLVAGSSGLSLTTSAAFTANVQGTTLLAMSANGALLITSAGVAGDLTLTFDAGSNNPLDGIGFAFTGTFTLVVNTTGSNYYVQSDGSISQMVPAAGATTANTISAGPGGDTSTPGSAYFEVDASGALVFGTAANGFALNGDLFLAIGTAGLAVSTNAAFTATVGGSTVITLNASGAMEITSAGLAASLTLTASGGNDLFSDSSLPFGLTGEFTFQVNTTGKAVNDMVGSTQLDLPAGPYFQIYVSGTLGLGTSNTSAATGLFLNGTYYLTISGNGMALAATTTLTATFDGTTLLSLGADGGLLLNSSGLVGAINLTLGSGSTNPLSGTGFSYAGTFTLQINTTGSTYYFWSNGQASTNAPDPTANPGVSVITTVSAGPGGSSTGSAYFQVYASGAMVFGSSSNGFALSGSFYLAVGTTGLSVSASAAFTATVLGSQLVSVNASGAMEITPAGLAASISLTVPSLGISNVFSLSGTFAFQINTTNKMVTDTVGGVALDLPKGPYFQLSVTQASLGFGGNGAGFGLTNGSFILTITSGGMAVSATATLGVTVGTVSMATFTATGAMLITTNGIAAKLNLSLTAGFSQSGSSGFGFQAAFVLEINTTSSAIGAINNVAVNLPRGPYFEILASGSLVMGGVVNIIGSFTFTLESNDVLISMNAAVSVFGVSFSASGFAAIYNTGGIAMQITLSVGNSSNPTVTIIPGVLALTGSFFLQINTTGNSSFTVDGVTYNFGNTAFEISVQAALNVFGFQMASASMTIKVYSDGTFYTSGSTQFDFFGFAWVNVTFSFDSKGDYSFSGTAGVQLGSDSFNIHGTLTVFFYHNVSPSTTIFTLSVSGGVTAFDWNFASVGASVSINGTDVSISVYVSVSFYFFSIGGTVTIDLGSIIPVPAPPPPPVGTVLISTAAVDGESFGAGTLLLNIGQYANANRGVGPLADEDYTISEDSSGNLFVSAQGVNGGAAEEYSGVSEIVVPNPDIGNGTSNVTLNISSGVRVPIVIFAGSGNNSFNLAGTVATTTINGSSGNDTVHGGPGAVIFNAGAGTNVFYGGAGTATISGSTGNDSIFGGSGNVTFNVGSGQSTFVGGGNGNTSNIVNDPGSVLVSETGYDSYSLVGTSPTAATLSYDGNTITLNNTSGGITVALTGATTGTQTFYVKNFYGDATLDAAGNASVTTTIVSTAGNLTLTGNTVTETNGPTGTITLQSTNGSNSYAYGTLSLEGGSAANVLTVNSWDGTGVVTLNGEGGSDTYVINFQSTGGFTVNVTDDGTGVMIANGTTAGNPILVSGSAVTLGSQTADYSNIEELTVFTQSNGETVNVTGISAPTIVNTGGFTDTVNVGSNAATGNTGGTLDGINASLTVAGSSSYDTLNLDDSGDGGADTSTLSAGTLSGLFGAGGSLTYSNLKNLNLYLGTGNVTLNITSTSSTTKIDASLGTNTINIGSEAPAMGGVLSGIKGPVTIVGGGRTTLNVDDTGDAAAAGTLGNKTLKGLGMVSGGITYSGLVALNISLGNNGNIFGISDTSSTTTTTLNTGAGSDTVNLLTDSGTTIINGQGGGDTINVSNDGAQTTITESSGNNTINLQATGAVTNVQTSLGANTINIGSLAPALNGITNGIQGAVYITGSGNDTLNVGDIGAKNSQTGYLTATTLTGLGMGALGITYAGLQTLVISLGSGGNSFNVLSTCATTVTTLNTGTGLNTVTVTSNAPATIGGVVSGIAGELIVNGQGYDTMNVNDTGDSAGGTLIQTTTTLAGLGMGPNGIVYASIETLNISMGAGNDTVYIQGNPAGTVENLNTGGGANIISIGSQAQSAIVTDTNAGDAYSTLGNATNTGSVLDNVQGTINITGSGNDTLNVDDSGSNTAAEGGMWSNKLDFLDPATNYTTVKVTINFTGLAGIYISLSQANDEFLVVDTFTSASATPVVVIDGNGGNDTFVVFDAHAVMTINGGSGDDSFYDFGNSAVLNLNGDAGDDTFYVYASVSASATNVGAGTAADSNGNKVFSYRVNAPVNVDGGTGNDKLFIFGTVLNDTFTITATSVTGAGLDVNYTNIKQLTIAGLGGDDTFYIESISVPTTVIGDGTIVLPSVANFLQSLNVSLPDLTGGAPASTSYNDTFFVGWQGASYIPGSLAGIAASLTIYGDNGPNAAGQTINQPGSNDTINVDDSADLKNQSFVLTSSTLTGTGFGTGGFLTYDTAVENLNFQLGNGNNTMTVNSTGTGVQTCIYGGRGNDAFIVNDANGGVLASPLALFGNVNTVAGDSLTINGAPEGNTFDITAYTIDGCGATISYEDMERLTINAAGPTTFTVNGDIVPTYLNGGSGDDIFTVNSNIVSLYLTSGSDDNTYVINANSGTLTAYGDASSDAGNDTFTVNANSGTMTLNGGAGNDFFLINGSGGALTVNGGPGQDTFTVNALSAPATINGDAGDAAFIVNEPLAAALTVTGGNPLDLLTINGTTGDDFVTITGSAVSGMGAAVNYSGTNLTVNGVAGNDTFVITSTSAFTTRVNGGTSGNDTFDVQATTGALYLTGAAVGNNLFNLGSLAPVFGGTLANIVGPVFITGGANSLRPISSASAAINTINVDDSGDLAGQTGLLTSSTLTGLGMGAGLTFGSVNFFNVYLGSGNDTFNVQSTNSATVTTLNTGTGADVVNVGSLAPAANGLTSGIQGALIVVGSGNDTLNVDDTGDTIGRTGTLTATTLTGLGLGTAGITYSGLAVLNINLGSGGNTFTIASTATATVTILNSGSGNDTVNVQSTGGATIINTGAGINTINVGSLAPAVNGLTSGIQGALTVVGSGKDTLNVDDTGDTVGRTGTLTATTLTGLGMGAAGITYRGLVALNLSLGSGNDQFTILGVTNSTVTTIDGRLGTNTAIINVAGNFAAQNLTLLNFASGSLSVGGDFSGVLNFSGALTTVTIGGSLTSTGILRAASVGVMMVGGDLAGLLSVTGLLNTLTVDGGTPGAIVAGDVNVITVKAGYGNSLLNVTENGVQREILAAPVAGGTMPGTVLFAFVYDSETSATPQVAIRITDGDPVARSFNLELWVVNSSTAKFDLSLLDSSANGKTGISNVSIDGDILVHLTAPELQLFTDLTASSRAGVVLPADSITGVEVSGILPIGFIQVTGIEGVAFAITTTAAGVPVNVSSPLSQGTSLWNLLGSHALVMPATDAFVLPVNTTQSVRLFAHDNTTNLNLDQIMILSQAAPATAPLIATVQVIPTTKSGTKALVQSVDFAGSGGSLSSALSIANITSTGALGSVAITASSGTTVNNAPGLGNITAPSIFGSINVTNAPIYGVIQTTSGDLGATILNSHGQVTGVTTISATSISGQIISRGNLISSVQTSGAFSGVIAAQGDIGAILRNANGTALTSSNALTCFGGIAIGGADSGQIIALGNLFGNLTVSGTMTGRLAIQGRAVAGLAAARLGILGNVSVKTFAASSSIVSGGLVGDAAGATTVSLGHAQGFIAAAGGANLHATTLAATSLLLNQLGINLDVLEAVFTNGAPSLQFDTGGTLNGLGLIEKNLAALQDDHGLLTGTV